MNKYQRTIKGQAVDVYDVLAAWEVTCPATAHAIKKLLMPGKRGSKGAVQDLKEAHSSIARAIELADGKDIDTPANLAPIVTAGTIWEAADGTTLTWVFDVFNDAPIRVKSVSLVNGKVLKEKDAFPMGKFFAKEPLVGGTFDIRDDVKVRRAHGTA